MGKKRAASSTKDILMILLHAKGAKGEWDEEIRGRTRLMKMVFLFKEEIRPQLKLQKAVPDYALPDFVPYDYGPFSAQVYSDLEFLIRLDFIASERIETGKPQPAEIFEYQAWASESLVGDDESSIDDTPVNEEKFFLTSLGKDFVNDEFNNVFTDEQWEGIARFKKQLVRASLNSIIKYVYEKYETMTTKSKIRDSVIG